jgi:hypothetical protein
MATREFSSLFDSAIERAPANCGPLLAIRNRGWLWMLDRQIGMQDVLAADGIVGFGEKGLFTTFRARRVDFLRQNPRKAEVSEVPLSSLPYTKPPNTLPGHPRR